MCSCSFNADKIFRHFKVINFPKPFVGLEVTQNLKVEVNLSKSAYIQTIYDGTLMNFEDAREISANHRAFIIEQIDTTTLKITFKPTNECIFKGKLQNLLPNRFVVCLSVIQIDGRVCCGDTAHQEIGRYYINGEYESINIFHKPNEINFGNVAINSKSSQNVRFFNESDKLFVNIKYERVTGFEIYPDKFTLTPKSSKNVKILAKPVSLKTVKSLPLQVRNSVELNEENNMNSNFLRYAIKVNINVQLEFNKMAKIPKLESLHKLIELDPRYAYMEGDQESVIKKRNIALKQLEYSKSLSKKKKSIQREIKRGDECQRSTPNKPDNNFCVIPIPKICTHEVLNVFITPFYINLGKVGVATSEETILTVINNTKYVVDVSFHKHKYVKYTQNLLKHLKVKIQPLENFKLMISVRAYCENEVQGTFSYTIDNRFLRQHPYCIHGEEPRLEIKENILKFGMISSEYYVTATSIRIFNNFQESISYRWGELHDSPFTVTPISGSVSKKSTQVCNFSLDFRKANKTRTYFVDFISLGNKIMITPIELHIISRKMGVKFLQPTVCFKDVPLNLETKEKIQLENASKEIAYFFFVEPILPGITIEPMKGIIRPKAITTFTVTLKIACVLEFNVEVTMRINGKENLILTISGHIIEPNVTVHPKNIYMARVPGEMITYVPVTFQNQSSLKCTVEFLDTGNIDDFNVYILSRYERQKINNFTLQGNETKIIYVKVYDDFRRQFDIYLPFQINGFIGPPTKENFNTDLGYYTGPHELLYENNAKVKVKPVRKEISYVHLWGVITIPWIKLTPDKYEINYIHGKENKLDFTMTNVSKYDLNILIAISKLSPHFTLKMNENNDSIDWINDDSEIKYVLKSGSSAELAVNFHPKGFGRFVSVALLYFVKHTSIPYHNLTFIGNRGEPDMESDKYHIIFPPSKVGNSMSQEFKIKLWTQSTLDAFSYSSYDDTNILVEIVDCENTMENETNCCIITINVTVSSETSTCRYTIIRFLNSCGSYCEVEVCYCYSHCPLTLLASNHINFDENPYPYYPERGTSLYNQMEVYMMFLQKWLYIQGFRRELYPTIPDTIHATSTNIALQAGKSKGVNGSYINFIRRMAGPLLKMSKTSPSTYNDLSFQQVKEVYDTYKDILLLLRLRGANAWVIQPKYLLSYEQFAIFTQNSASRCTADRIETMKLLEDENLYYRLNKQCWFDFIIQSYKVLVVDTCFFECICITNEPRDVVKILIQWYNDHISLQHNKLIGKDKKEIQIQNIVEDLTDGLALTSVFLSYCPFLQDHFSLFSFANEENYEAAVVNNACLLIEAINLLKLFFPLNVKSFLKPNFLEMFFLSIHLYVTLPMFSIKQIIHFNPPLLRSSVRQMIITPLNQESLTFNYFILHNSGNNFVIEKNDEDKEKKVVIYVKFTCNFLAKETAMLLVHGFNKTRIFDTYMTFMLKGEVGSINPMKKCKVIAPLYRSIKVDILIASPFESTAVFKIYVTDVEPELPVSFSEYVKPRFYLRRLNSVEKEISLKGHSTIIKEPGPIEQEQKVCFNLICLSNQVGTSWVWFRSEIGEFYIRIMTHPRSDLPIEYLEAKILALPIEPCSCGEECECYRTTAVLIPHRNDVLIKSLRQSLTTYASELMLDIFDKHIETATGRIVLTKLLREGGTIMSEVEHIMRNANTYKITSRSLKLHFQEITLSQYSPQMFILPITVLAGIQSEKFNITFTSQCGLNIRTYKIILTGLNISVCTSNSSVTPE